LQSVNAGHQIFFLLFFVNTWAIQPIILFSCRRRGLEFNQWYLTFFWRRSGAGRRI
jgi:hypothetical protein